MSGDVGHKYGKLKPGNQLDPDSNYCHFFISSLEGITTNALCLVIVENLDSRLAIVEKQIRVTKLG